MVRKCKKNCTNFKKEVAILDLKSTKNPHKLSSVTAYQSETEINRGPVAHDP